MVLVDRGSWVVYWRRGAQRRSRSRDFNRGPKRGQFHFLAQLDWGASVAGELIHEWYRPNRMVRSHVIRVAGVHPASTPSRQRLGKLTTRNRPALTFLLSREPILDSGSPLVVSQRGKCRTDHTVIADITALSTQEPHQVGDPDAALHISRSS